MKNENKKSVETINSSNEKLLLSDERGLEILRKLLQKCSVEKVR